MSAAGQDPVLVTGGTGFLGRALVRALRACGAPVHALARASSDRAPLAGLGVVWHAGDLCDAAAVERAVAAAAAAARASGAGLRLIHSGAVISYRSGDGERARAVNVEGTRHVLEAARRHGVRRAVHVSSVVAVGHAVDGPLDERAAFNNGGLGVDYVDTKRAAEEFALAAAGELELVVVNPGAIFGPVSEGANTARFIRAVLAGRGPALAPPGGIAAVGLDDAVDGTLRALERGRSGERYILVESNHSLLELFRRVARLGGVRPVRFAVPRAAWPAVVLGARLVDRVRPLQLAPPQGLVLLGLDMHFDGSKARRELGWSPRPFDAVLRETVEHLRASAAAARVPPP